MSSLVGRLFVRLAIGRVPYWGFVLLFEVAVCPDEVGHVIYGFLLLVQWVQRCNSPRFNATPMLAGRLRSGISEKCRGRDLGGPDGRLPMIRDSSPRGVGGRGTRCDVRV